MNVKHIIIIFIFLIKSACSKGDTLKCRLNYGLTLSGLTAITFDKNANYFKNGVDNYPLFYSIGFYLNGKRHTFEAGIINQIVNANSDWFYYSLGYSYRLTRKNRIVDISATIKTISSLYQVQNPAKDVRQDTYNDMTMCFGPTISKNINRFRFHLNLFCLAGLTTYIKQYKNGHIPTLNADKPQYLSDTFFTELKIAFRLNKKS